MNPRSHYHHAINSERTLRHFIPYSTHPREHTIATKDGDYLTTWRVGGLPFETCDPDNIHIPKEQLNTLLRSIGSAHVALWQHTIRRQTHAHLFSDYTNPFCRQFDQRYSHSINTDQLYQSELYLTLIYRPAPSRTLKQLIRLSPRRLEDHLAAQEQALKALDDLADQIEAALQPYQLRRLSTHTASNGVTVSEPLSFLNTLITGHWQDIQLPRAPLDQYLGNAQVHIGTETIGIHTPTHTRYAQCIDFKAYNGFTEPGLLDGLLYEHYDSIITQSFSMTNRSDGERLLRRQQRHLANTDDGSATQIAQIDQAIDELIDGQFVIGEYHYSMMIYADSIEQLRLNTRSAMSIIEEQGFLASLTSTALDAAWYAQLPANWFYRPRIAHLTSRNFAGLACLHNFPEGKARNNPWGDAVTIFKTPAGQPFYFNFHHSSPQSNDLGKHVLGNTRIIGQSGAGKTVLMNTLFIQAQKYRHAHQNNFSSVFFDKDEGARLCILAAGGRYLSFKNGQPTGLNPFQLEPNNTNQLFLESLIRHLVTRNEHPITTADEQRIAEAIATVLNLPRPLRRLSTLLQNLTESTDSAERDNSLVKRLAPWCADDGNGKRGSLAWVLDNEHDRLDFNAVANTGIDGTDFLDNDEIRTPITLYLLHRMRDVMDGRRFIYWMDEAWKWLDDPAFEAFAGDGQATIRKKNGLGVFATQSPRTVLDAAIAPQLIEQVATEIFLPNPRASAQDYIDGFGLSHTEYQLIKELPEHSHRFLIRQQNRSVIAWLDLRGFDDELAILSGTTADNALATQIMSERGDDPEHWLPEFHRRRKTPSSS